MTFYIFFEGKTLRMKSKDDRASFFRSVIGNVDLLPIGYAFTTNTVAPTVDVIPTLN